MRSSRRCTGVRGCLTYGNGTASSSGSEKPQTIGTLAHGPVKIEPGHFVASRRPAKLIHTCLQGHNNQYLLSMCPNS